MTAAQRRILGFVALAHGIGLRLDSSWQWTALVLIVAGGALVVQALVTEAFVSGRGER